MQLLLSVGKDTREKFSGAVEAFSRRNPTNSSPQGDQTKHRMFEDVPQQKDMVIFFFPTKRRDESSLMFFLGVLLS